MEIKKLGAVGITVLLLIWAVGIRGAALNPQSASSHDQFDGAWWLSKSSAEQLGFRDGLADCYVWEARKTLPQVRSAKDDQAFITDFYHENPDKVGVPIFEVFLSAAGHPSQADKSGGEHFAEPHGYWDGLWWKGWNEPELPLSQRGFVEGYLWCYKEKTGSPRGTFSKSPDEYVKLITKWYENAGPDETKIADVLFRFRDNAKPTSLNR